MIVLPGLCYFVIMYAVSTDPFAENIQSLIIETDSFWLNRDVPLLVSVALDKVVFVVC